MITVSILLGISALVLGLFVSQQVRLSKERAFAAFHGTLLNQPRLVSSFALMGGDGVPFTNASLKGQWTMLFFGFTHCGAICPTTMAQLSKMMHLLEESGVTAYPRVVMVSVDPERDSLEQLDKYVKGFHSQFYAARGEEGSIGPMTHEMGIAYGKVAHPSSQKDDIEHTGTILLFNPDGKLSAFFTSPHDPASMAEDYKLVAQL